MFQTRPLFVLLTAYVVSLFALALAAVAGWMRCGRGEDCAPDLAWAVIAAGPAALIAIIMLLLLRARASSAVTRSAILAAGVAVATAPFAAFIFRDVRFIPAFVVLLAGAVWLVLRAEDEVEEGPAAYGTPAQASAPPVAEPSPKRQPTLARPTPGARARRSLGMVAELSVLNRDILRLCDGLIHTTREGEDNAGVRLGVETRGLVSKDGTTALRERKRKRGG